MKKILCWLVGHRWKDVVDQKVIDRCFKEGGWALFGMAFIQWPKKCERCGAARSV